VKFKVGDKVIFKLGHRELSWYSQRGSTTHISGVIDTISYINSDAYYCVELSDKVIRIIDSKELDNIYVPYKDLELDLEY